MTNAGRKFTREPLTTLEVNQFLDAFGKGPTGVRNRALCVVMLRGGLRLQEALDLETKDLSAEHRTLRVCHGKGDKARLSKLDVAAWALLDQWLAERKQMSKLQAGVVFVTLRDKKLSQQYVRAMCGRIRKRAGISKRVHPHGFRHTWAESMAREGAQLKTIQLGLGHAKASTTDTYVRDLYPEELLVAIDDRPDWRPVKES